MAEPKKDLAAEAKSFCDGLSNVFVLKKRDAQGRHLLEQAKTLIESLIAENQRLSNSGGTPRMGRSGGGMGQLWMKLDEMKRENEELRRQLGKSHDERPVVGKSQGPGEVIISELHKTRSEKENLRGQVEKMQKSVKDMNVINTNLQDEYKRLRIALDTTNRSLETARREYKTLESSLNNAKSENDALRQQLVNSPSRTVPRRDNRHCENINERCRPSVIAMKYDTLESQQWVDAKESLEDTTNKDEECIVKFLCSLLMSSYEASEAIFEKLLSAISALLKHPSIVESLGQNDLPPIQKAVSEELKDAVLASLRQNFEDIETSPIIKVATLRLPKEYNEFIAVSSLENKAVNRYLHECARITWQMIIQQPQMRLSTTDTTFNEDRHRLWWSCDKMRNSISHFIWPALYDYEDGNLMIKGCVYSS